MSKYIFAAATAILAFGVIYNLDTLRSLGGTGMNAMNSYYLLAIVLYAAAGAAELIWPGKR